MTALAEAQNPFLDAEPWGRCHKENYRERYEGGTADKRRRRRARASASPEELWRDYTAGLLDPVPMDLPVPGDASEAVRRVAADMSLPIGLRLAAGDLRPVPYACRWRAGVLGLSYRTVARALKTLVEAGALEKGDPLPPRADYPRGTAKFLPPPSVCRSAVVSVQWAVAPVQLANHAASRARPGNRYRHAHWLACRLAERGLDSETAALFMSGYVKRCPAGDHPYTDREAAATLRSVYRHLPKTT